MKPQMKTKNPASEVFLPKDDAFCLFVCFCFCFFCFLGPQLQHMEVSRLGAKWELQLPAYTTATAMLDPSHVCDLHHSSRQHWILNPLSEAGDQTCVLMDTSWLCYH